MLEYIICKQSWCSLFILLLLAEIWHIHPREQSLNCDLKNAFIRKGLAEMFIYDVALDNAWILDYPFCTVLKSDHRRRVYAHI